MLGICLGWLVYFKKKLLDDIKNDSLLMWKIWFWALMVYHTLAIIWMIWLMARMYSLPLTKKPLGLMT
jgi:hypothetical protein